MSQRRGSTQNGSIALFALFVCLAVAVLAQTVGIVVICAYRGQAAEETGRALLAQKDEALSLVRQDLLGAWAPRGWTVVPALAGDVSTSVDGVADSGGLAMEVRAKQPPEVSAVTVSAWAERGRDGIDLPLAALVARTALYVDGRVAPWLEVDPAVVANDGPAAAAWFLQTPAELLLGTACTAGSLTVPWKLDEGWCRLAGGQRSGVAAEGLAPGPGAFLADARGESTQHLPPGWGESADAPGLMVVTGGPSVDATGRGDIFGVIVVDGGGVNLEGTRLHGAVFTTGAVDLGSDGVILFAPAVLRWATDRSLVRTRLLPGTRRESLG